MTARPQLPNPIDSVALASLNTPDGWLSYPLGDDVIEGNPDTQMKLLRTVGVKTPYKAVAFFTALNSGCFSAAASSSIFFTSSGEGFTFRL